MPLLAPFTNLRRPGQQNKPTGVPMLDYGHPLSQGLIAYWFDHGLGGEANPHVELIGWRPLLNWTNNVFELAAIDQIGAAIKFAANASLRYSSDAIIRNLQGAPPWCIACGVQIKTFANSCSLFGRLANGGGSAPFTNWKFQLDSATGATAHLNSGGADTTITGGVYAVNVFTTFALNATSASAADFYVNGVKAAGATGLTIQNAPPADEIQMMAGPADGLAGSFYYGAIWGRALTAAEQTQLHNDPWCFLTSPEYDMPALFTPPPPPPPPPIAGPGGSGSLFIVRSRQEY